MQQRICYSAVHPDDPDEQKTFCDWVVYPDQDGRAIDFYGETIDPALARKVLRLKTPPQAGQPIQPGLIIFLLRTIGLTHKQCEAFVMAEGYGATEAQIAAALGIRQQTANEHLSLARERCRRWAELRRTPALMAA